MKTTLELPSELMKAIKLRAVEEDRTLTELITELLRKGMTSDAAEPRVIRHRVQLPLLYGAHAPASEEELSPERMAEILLAQETEAQHDLMR